MDTVVDRDTAPVDKVRVDKVHPGKVGDKAQAAPVVEEAEGGVAAGAPTIPADREPPADPARRATTRMAFTPRPWTTVIAPR
jgi:hypothetical protein